MRTSDLLEILGTFTAENRRNFKAFLCSPYFVDPKNQETLLALCQLVFDEIDHPDSALSDEVIYMRIFPKGEKVKNKLEKLRSDLLGFARTFIKTEYANARFSGDLEHLALAHFFSGSQITQSVFEELQAPERMGSQKRQTRLGTKRLYQPTRDEKSVHPLWNHAGL